MATSEDGYESVSVRADTGEKRVNLAGPCDPCPLLFPLRAVAERQKKRQEKRASVDVVKDWVGGPAHLYCNVCELLVSPSHR